MSFRTVDVRAARVPSDQRISFRRRRVSEHLHGCRGAGGHLGVHDSRRRPPGRLQPVSHQHRSVVTSGRPVGHGGVVGEAWSVLLSLRGQSRSLAGGAATITV